MKRLDETLKGVVGYEKVSGERFCIDQAWESCHYYPEDMWDDYQEQKEWRQSINLVGVFINKHGYRKTFRYNWQIFRQDCTHEDD